MNALPLGSGHGPGTTCVSGRYLLLGVRAENYTYFFRPLARVLPIILSVTFGPHGKWPLWAWANSRSGKPHEVPERWPATFSRPKSLLTSLSSTPRYW